MADDLQGAKLSVLVQRKDFAAALALGKALFASQNDHPDVLNAVAWTMVDPEHPFPNPDLDLALKVALRATEVSHGENAAILDTLARVYFVKGDLDKAIATQTKAVEKSHEDEKDEIAKTLEEYKAKKDGSK